MNTVLIVEDDEPLARGLMDNLRFEGLEVRRAASAEQALEDLGEATPDLMLLDLMLPEKSGFDVLRAMDGEGERPRVIVVSARDAEADVVRALDLGAHDYVKKPFALGELLARVRAQLRQLAPRAADGGDDAWCFGDIRVDFARFRLWKDESESLLSHHEVEMLRLFRERPDQPIRRAEILRAAWGEDAYPSERTVDNFVVKLRKRIEDDPSRPRRLLTVHGVGYRFVVDPPSDGA